MQIFYHQKSSAGCVLLVQTERFFVAAASTVLLFSPHLTAPQLMVARDGFNLLFQPQIFNFRDITFSSLSE
jgi:hypothetical protein